MREELSNVSGMILAQTNETKANLSQTDRAVASMRDNTAQAVDQLESRVERRVSDVESRVNGAQDATRALESRVREELSAVSAEAAATPAGRQPALEDRVD
eukprot:COSAG01_NODE_6097_length_3852_cov_1.910472_2_plen_100_part_01